MKSSNHWGKIFFKIILGASPCRGKVIIVTKGGIIQVKTIIILTFFSRKSHFYGHFWRKSSFHFNIITFERTNINCSLANFKRAASSHEKLYIENEEFFNLYVAFYHDLLIAHL